MNIYNQIGSCSCLPAERAIYNGSTTKMDTVFVDSVTVFLLYCNGNAPCGSASFKVFLGEKVYIRKVNYAPWASTDYYNQDANDSINVKARRQIRSNMNNGWFGGSSVFNENFVSDEDISILFTSRLKDFPAGATDVDGIGVGFGLYHTASMALPQNYWLGKKIQFKYNTGQYCTFSIKGGGFHLVTYTGGVATRNKIEYIAGIAAQICNYYYPTVCPNGLTGFTGSGYPYSNNMWGRITGVSIPYLWATFRNYIAFGNADYWNGFEPILQKFGSPLGNRCSSMWSFSANGKSQAENDALSNQLMGYGLMGDVTCSPCLSPPSCLTQRTIRWNANGLGAAALATACNNKWWITKD